MTSRILVIEDDPAVVGKLKKLLSEFGYDFLGAVSDPGAALDSARLLHPDLILMDIFFQGRPDGLDLAQRLHDETGVRIVFVGGTADPSIFMRMVQADPVGCVDKPIDPNYLYAVLNRAMRGSGSLSAAAAAD